MTPNPDHMTRSRAQAYVADVFRRGRQLGVRDVLRAWSQAGRWGSSSSSWWTIVRWDLRP